MCSSMTAKVVWAGAPHVYVGGGCILADSPLTWMNRHNRQSGWDTVPMAALEAVTTTSPSVRGRRRADRQRQQRRQQREEESDSSSSSSSWDEEEEEEEEEEEAAAAAAAAATAAMPPLLAFASFRLSWWLATGLLTALLLPFLLLRQARAEA